MNFSKAFKKLNYSIDKPSHVDVVLLFKHMSLIIKSGISVYEGLRIVAEQTSSKPLKRILAEIVVLTGNGEMLAQAMAKYPSVFKEFHLSLVKIGEESGTLDDNFNYLADYLTKDYKLKKKIQGALFYPTVVFCAMIGIGIFITVFILPKITDFYKGYNQELPIATKLLLDFSDLIQNHGLTFFATLLGFIIVFIYLYRLPSLRLIRDTYILKIPIMGNFIIKKELVLLTRNIGVLVKSGIPIVKALDVASRTLTNKKFAVDLGRIHEQVSHGFGIGVAIESIKDTPIPIMLTRMLDIGDRTGSLGDVSVYLSDFYEDDVDNIAANLSSALEPILLVLMGVMVGYVAIAILTPIYSITDTIGS